MTDIRLEQGLLESGVPIGVSELPEVFFEAVRRRFPFDGDGRMLALWRGAVSFLTFAGDFESILIVDPEPGRLAESLREAERMGIENAIILEGGMEVLHPRGAVSPVDRPGLFSSQGSETEDFIPGENGGNGEVG